MARADSSPFTLVHALLGLTDIEERTTRRRDVAAYRSLYRELELRHLEINEKDGILVLTRKF